MLKITPIQINKICGYIGVFGQFLFMFLYAGGMARYIDLVAFFGLQVSSMALCFLCAEEGLSDTFRDIQTEQKFLKEVTENFFRRTTFIEMDRDKR